MTNQASGGDDVSRLASGWLLSLLGIASTAIFVMAFEIVIARGLGATGAGIFFVAVSLFMLLLAASDLGSAVGMVRTVARLRALGRHRDVRRLLPVALAPPVVSSTALAIALWGFSSTVAEAVLDGEAAQTCAQYLRTFAFFLPLATVSATVIGTTRGFDTMLPMVGIEQIGKSLSRLVLALVAVLAGAGAFALALAWAIPIAAGLVAATWSLIILFRHSPAAPGGVDRDASRWALGRAFWAFTIPLGVAGVLQIALLWLDTILVAALKTPADAGIYRAAVRYITQTMIANTAIVFVIGPALSALLAQAYKTRAQELYSTATMWTVTLAWPLALTLATFAPLLMRVYGSEFESGANALTIVSLALLLGTAAGPVSVVLVMAGKSGWHLTNITSALVANIGLNLLLTPKYGMTGAAIAWAAAIAINNIAPLVQTRILVGIHPFTRGLAAVGIAATVCFAGLGIVTRLVFPLEPASFIGFVVVASATYLAVLWRMRGTLHLAVFRDAILARRRGPGKTRADAPLDAPI